MALNGIFHLFFEMKLSDLHLILEDFKKKEHNKKLCKESFENRLYGILHTCIKGSPLIFKHYNSNLCFYQQQSSLFSETSHI